MTAAKALIDYLGGLTLAGGDHDAELFEVLPWERRFLRGAFKVSGPAALSLARGNGKSALVAAVACAVADCCFARYMTTDFPDCLTRPVPGFPRLFGLCRSAAPVLTVSEVGAVALSD